MINSGQLRELIVRPALQHLTKAQNFAHANSPAAEELVMGTIAHESMMGSFLKQHPTGPALGIGQIEPETHQSLWEHYLQYRASLADSLRTLASVRSIHSGKVLDSELIGNLIYNAAMVRVVYLPAKPALPGPADLQGQGEYYAKYYNKGGKGTAEKYIKDYRRYVLGLVV